MCSSDLAAVLEAEGQREAAIKVAEGNKQAAILNAEGQKQAAILHAEGSRQAAVLEAEGYAAALTKIQEVGRGLDANTLGLQYLDMMKGLASSDASKWIVPTELTRFISAFSGNKEGSAGGPG